MKRIALKLPKSSQVKKHIAIILVIFLIGASITVGIFRSNSKTPTEQTTEAFLQLYRLTGSGVGNGATFKRPDGFSELKEWKGPDQVLLYQTENNESQRLLGFIALSISNFTEPIPADGLKELNDIMTNSENSFHEDHIMQLEELITRNLGSTFDTTIDIPKKVTLTNIKNHVWGSEFSANYIATKTYAPIKGKVILAVGEKTYYYFMVGAVDYNWHANQEVWSRVINSLKIDQ
ncbi:MAG: hypothetical protein WD877_01095 [Candidatus Saccharimonadales bacterium]